MRKIWKLQYQEKEIFISSDKVTREALDFLIASDIEFLLTPLQLAETLDDINKIYEDNLNAAHENEQ